MDEMSENKNLLKFKKRFGFVPENDKNHKVIFENKKAKNDEKILYINENGNAVRMNSLYNPTYEAERWTGRYEQPEDRALFFINGFSSGYFVRALRRKLRPDSIFIIYEPNESLLRYVLDNFDVYDLISDNNIYFYVSDRDDEGMYSFINWNINDDKTYAIGITTPGYVKSSKFEKMCDDLSLVAHSSRGYRASYGKSAMANTFYAVSQLNKNYYEFDFASAFPKDVPVIIAAGGPSLLKNIDDLKRAKGKALIAAVDRTATILADHGIIPDLMLTVDPNKAPEFLIDDRIKDAPLVAAYSANKKTMEFHNGHLIFMHLNVDIGDIPGMNGRNIEFGDMGGSVATAAYLMFAVAGVKNIILIGQDLAYTDNKFHADNRYEYEMDTDPLEVEGINGEMLKTGTDLKQFLNFYERTIKKFPSTHVVDATEGGALIHGTEIITLNEAIDKYCDKGFDMQDLLSKVPHAQTDEEHEKTIEFMKDRIRELNIIREKSGELVPLCYRLMNVSKYGDIREKKYWKMYHQIDDLRRDILVTLVNRWLEGSWIEQSDTIPQHVFYVRDNDEALIIYEKAYKYYKRLPAECDSLEKCIREIFDIEGAITDEI